MLDHIDPATIADPALRALVLEVLNVLNAQAAQIAALTAENARLRDEINRLKGEHGRPTIKPPTPPTLSSEAERRTPRPRQPRPKQARLVITREQVCRCDPATLPGDAVFKGYDDVIVQDLRLEREVICFHQETFYSPSLHRTFQAPLPPGYRGQFGPELRAFVLSEYFGANVSQPALRRVLGYVGIEISAGQVAEILTGQVADFHTESSAVLAAGLASSRVQQIDDTATRCNGQNLVCEIITNPCYTAFRTVGGKDRLNVLRALTDGQAVSYVLNACVLDYLRAQGLAAKWRTQVAMWPQDVVWSEAEVTARLGAPEWARLPVGARKLLLEGLALGGYRAQTVWRPVGVLLADDAPQWEHISAELALCWVHEGRHYKKLVPRISWFRTLLVRFQGRFWRFYKQLQAYQAAPEPGRAKALRTQFRRLFGTVTGYEELDEVIRRTRGKEAPLLRVLQEPQVPLHNNAAELGARARVRKRDVSFGPRSPAGLKAWDTFMTLVETTRKLGVNFLAYVRDRLCGAGMIPPLGELIQTKAATLKLTPA